MKKVIVLGSFVVDLMGRADHIPVEGETVKGDFFRAGAGGKGSNQAIAAYRSGGDVALITKVGKDLFSHYALDFYKSEGMDTRFVYQDENLPTGIALILVSNTTSQNSILVVSGACGNITKREVEKAKEVLQEGKVLLCQLETNLDVIPEAVDFIHKNGGMAILNPAPAHPGLEESFVRKFDLVTPNETEAEALSGVKVINRTSAEKAAEKIQQMGVRDVVITLGKSGSLLKRKGKPAVIFPPIPVKVLDTTGAGDAFNGGLASAIAQGDSLEEAMFFATVVASLAITKLGTAPAMPTKVQIGAFLKDFDKKAYMRSVK